MDAPTTTQVRIEDALLALIAEGEHLNHDNVAARAGVSRRTVYRYFPDQDALRAAMWRKLGPPVGMPKSLTGLLDGLDAGFANFDAKAAAMTVAMASPEGRAIRNVMKPERTAAYRALLDEAGIALPEPDRTYAIAAIQLLASGFAWREMRDQWDMTAPEIATASRWAIETLLADLRERGKRPLAATAPKNERAAAE